MAVTLLRLWLIAFKVGKVWQVRQEKWLRMRALLKRMWRIGNKLAAVAALAGGCAAQEAVPLQGWLAGRPEWRVVQLDAGPWPLAVAEKPGSGRMVVYVEGDGHAYVRRDLPSMDPTPMDPVGLKLALADTSGATVVYLARPCQWAVKGPWCRPELWTRGRFSQTMADMYANAIVRLSRGQPVEVVGYSGGGWLALQVASRLPNVDKVVTVAGNVDPAWVNDFHKVSAIEVAPYGGRLATVAQVHYVGDRDRIVPEEAVRQFVDKVKPVDVRVVVVPGMGHGGWERVWGDLRD